mgnify:CR=1 FL=1
MKSKAMADIFRHFGFGGFIHHFKNLILRKEARYYNHAQVSLDKTYQAIDQYLSVTTSADERQCFEDFKSVVDQYAVKMLTLLPGSENFEKSSLTVLDTLVKVDDQPAIEAMSALSDGVATRFDEVKRNTDSLVDYGLGVLLKGGTALLWFWLLLLVTLFSVVAAVVRKDKYVRQLMKTVADRLGKS